MNFLPSKKQKLPKVTVIIPAYNEEYHIEKCLESIKKVNYPRNKIEVIVIDDGSTDDTRKIVSSFDVKLIKGKHEGVGVSRNLGIKKSTGKIILFLDADETINKNFIIEVVKPFRDEKIIAVDSSYKLVNKGIIPKLHFLRILLGIDYEDSVFPKICRKKTIKDIGMIKPKFGYYDDWDFKVRMSKKGKLVRVKEAICGKIEPENLREMWRQNKWAGESIVKLFFGYRKDTIRKLLFSFMCAPIPIYLMMLLTPFWFLGLFGILPFLFVELKRSFQMYRKTKWLESFLTPFFDVFTMDMYFIGILIGLLNIRSIPKV